MTPTKYANLTNQEVMDKLAQITCKREDNFIVLLEPVDSTTEILLEARNRIESFDNLKKLFEKPAYAKMSLDIMPNYELELNLKVNNGGCDK